MRITWRILARRLAYLTAEGAIVRSQYQVRPPRFEYVLTGKGRALSPVLETIEHWDRTWHDIASESSTVKRSGDRFAARLLHGL
ncbi:winged helix-turn-helix transcriptional regulator [Aeromicrobium sp. HA]|uniref:winged helix-turn-helix transcriptional regulator n=1 Tax=Aeromicrobium sp. HA TaxID=3009077 RepID=UPI0022AF6969|nr:winged helix-turn-helix transcriptional regulator [Aeromicrobium sp. HA]